MKIVIELPDNIAAMFLLTMKKDGSFDESLTNEENIAKTIESIDWTDGLYNSLEVP